MSLVVAVTRHASSFIFLLKYCYGAKRIRTADPLNAIEVLYQLSYNPVLRILRYRDNYTASSSQEVMFLDLVKQRRGLSHVG